MRVVSLLNSGVQSNTKDNRGVCKGDKHVGCIVYKAHIDIYMWLYVHMYM